MTAFPAFSQNVVESLRQAAQLHSDYEFEAAITKYDALLKTASDSALVAEIQQKKVLSENGRNMLLFSTRPEVVAAKTVEADKYFLYMSHLKQGEWVKAPNAFAPLGSNPVFFENSAKSIVFAAPDGSGHSKLMSSTLGENGVWSLPKAVESCASEGNEVYPLVSASGKELYFSSDAMAGMGGYDLYVCHWNERGKCWDAPENLGFPYSSTGDDFLFSNTPDGEFTVFASNRDCAPGKMTIYVLRFENSPIKKAVGSAEEAREIAELKPAAPAAEITATVEPEVKEVVVSAPEKARYAAIERLEALKERVRNLAEVRKGLRGAREISANESEMMELQRRISALSDSITMMDLDLIGRGVQPSFAPAKPEKASTPAPAKKASTYSFSIRSFGTMPQIQVEQPVVEDDPYLFSIGEQTEMMTELPDGIVYQIQVGVSSAKMKAKQFKGISPAFSRKQPSGKYLHSAGAFRTFADAEDALAQVKKHGFPSAYIIAFKNGKTIPVSKAKTLE